MLLRIPLGYYRQRKTRARENCHPYCQFQALVRTAQSQISAPQFSPLSTVPAHLFILRDSELCQVSRIISSIFADIFLLLGEFEERF